MVNTKLSSTRKDLMHLVINDNPVLVPIIHQLTHYRCCDSFLKWLVINKITGRNLVEWLKIQHENSVMSMVQFIIMKQNKERSKIPLILNKDWVR